MDDSGALDIAAQPHVDQPAPTARRRSTSLRWWFMTAVAAAALTAVGVLATVGDDAPAPVDVPVVVDGQDPVESDGTTVTTPCFSYRIPTDLILDRRRSTGCVTVVGFGDDFLTQIRVHAQTGGAGEDIDEIVAEVHGAMLGAEDLEIDAVTLHGRDAVRIRNVDGWGIRHATYLVPLPAGRFTQAGHDLGSIWLTGPSSREFDAWMATIIDSLEIPGG